MVPVILRLVVESWESVYAFGSDEREDNITVALCRIVKRNRTARELMFTIDTQQVELDPAEGEDMGRLDISFRPCIPREDIYFCLEGKRLNVIKEGVLRTYASEYVTSGMMRFISGQYAKEVQHGGMAGYVMDGEVPRAIQSVENNVRTHQAALGMMPPVALSKSSLLAAEPRARETLHTRKVSPTSFRIHHLFLAKPRSSSSRPD
jgi:hypothetical protein